MGRKAIIIAPGTKFGEWTVVKETVNPNLNYKSIYYLCKCSCGETAIIDGRSLRNGNSTKCKKCRARLGTIGNINKKETSKYIGVYHNKKRYIVTIKDKYLGSFDSELLAAQAYDEEARKEYGNKAILNFPREDDF